ncbi:MAG: CHASE3 domain-containing protein [Acetobacteraceae bacterium]|nr:CHASE3 domain-containing protein [Acetobacteraceae bacterium]
MARSKAGSPRAGRGWTQDLSTLSGVAAALSLALVVVAGVLLLLNLLRLAETRRLADVTVSVLDGARSLASDIIDAETGQRGYLLTGEAHYLRPYLDATARVWTDFAALEQRVVVAAQRERLKRLRPLVESKLAELAQTVELRARSFDEALAVVRTDEGQRLADEIRAALGEFERVARQLLLERNLNVEHAARTATLLAVGCGSLAFVSAALGVFGVLRRRDERQMVERNLRLEQEVEERTAALEEANAELEAFAATISHDLRAPIRAVGGYVEALLEDMGDALDEDGRDHLLRIGAAAERMDALIGDILAYSRLARQQLSLGRVALDAVVDAALNAHHEAAVAKGARITVVRPMPVVQAHAGALEAAVGNLVSNALKFTRPGEAPVVLIQAEPRDGGLVRLWVEDRGIGIPPPDEDRIFRPFERLHGREAYPGTGVGLSIVRRVAERLGGGCGVTTTPSGSRFWIDLRAAANQAGGGGTARLGMPDGGAPVSGSAASPPSPRVA